MFVGDAVSIAGTRVQSGFGAELPTADAVQLQAGAVACELLLLQGRPIGELVAQHGPFVMNTQAELRQAFFDYQRTQFGGWPWPKDGPAHPRTQGRFAKHADGRREERDG